MFMTSRRLGASIPVLLIGALLSGCGGGAPGTSGASSPSAGGSAADAPSGGTATVSWTAPAADINGMTGVAGYRIYYGSDAGSLTHTVEIDDAAAVKFTLTDLAPGVWYFAVADYNADRIQSDLSGVVQVTI